MLDAKSKRSNIGTLELTTESTKSTEIFMDRQSLLGFINQLSVFSVFSVVSPCPYLPWFDLDAGCWMPDVIPSL
jgi:hypothetical protein